MLFEIHGGALLFHGLKWVGCAQVTDRVRASPWSLSLWVEFFPCHIFPFLDVVSCNRQPLVLQQRVCLYGMPGKLRQVLWLMTRNPST